MMTEHPKTIPRRNHVCILLPSRRSFPAPSGPPCQAHQIPEGPWSPIGAGFDPPIVPAGGGAAALYALAMDYRTLGRTGVKVSPLCLGTMMFGAWGNQDHDDSIRIINRAVEAGINFFDTADIYSFGESEEIVGKALATLDRDTIVLATKVHGSMGKDPNTGGNS